MKISKIEARYLSYPLPSAFNPAWAPTLPGLSAREFTMTVVTVETSDGLIGFGGGGDYIREIVSAIPGLRSTS